MLKHFYLFSYPNDWQREGLAPFVLDDTLLHYISQRQDSGACHFWPSHKRVILGAMDKRLPYFEDAILSLEKAGYPPVVRTAGGLGVVDDPGVLNFSLLLANPHQKISIDGAYEIMLDLIRSWLAPYRLEVTHQEVPDSYCPGSYDLTVNGKKIAGLAQRRLSHAVGIMIYLSLSGKQEERGQLMRNFYTIGQGNEPIKGTYPAIDPSSMTSIENLLGLTITREQAIDQLISLISHRWPLQEGQMDWLDPDRLYKNWQKISRRQKGSKI
ncbi:protein--protein lipoyl transferase [Atopobacter sp. AH10]|uniref:lipoate--protein ligase family protein n=1 Tax=Atopobacter sp. AH10 TaxID=2315861 RepID=UPI000EF1DCA2|nr:protein--protein lipoyl transferase [Atopobacter sp. AH10]RLK63128.1 protein--protein lipoyl transferase [Atopobacter sp. AH10]